MGRIPSSRAGLAWRLATLAALWLALALPAALLGAWFAGWSLARASRGFLARLAARTTVTWDDAVLARIGGPLTLTWLIAVLHVRAIHAYEVEDASALPGFRIPAWRLFGDAPPEDDDPPFPAPAERP